MARSAAMMEAARTLGATPLTATIKLLIPATRPAIAGGVALVMMETAADFGVADFYGIPTLSTGIFRTWYGLGDLSAAAQLAALLFFVALILVFLEEVGRRGRMSDTARMFRASVRMKLAGPAAALAVVICAVPAIFGFVIPVMTLLSKFGGVDISDASSGLLGAGRNSAFVAGLGAMIVIIISTAMAYAVRLSPHPLTMMSVRAATLGYAVPGAVIAVGILGLLSAAGRLTSANAAMVTGIPVLLYAYTSRFLTVGYNAISSGLSQIDPSLDKAARMLGATTNDVLRRVHLPLLKGSVAAAAIVVFIDITKELPATLILRSFNFETLATKVYRLAGDERLAEAAPAALTLILLGLAPSLILNHIGEKK
jgi:iron(III) transport system permease protein